MITKRRGDTFEFPFIATDEEGNETVVIEKGTILRCGVRSTLSGAEYSLFQEIVTEEETSAVDFVFSASETAKLTPSDELAEYDAFYIVEVEVTFPNGIVRTPFQEELEVERDYVYE